MHRFAILIPARNEEEVVGDLIDSLHAQTYPSKNIDIYVLADNCSDHTAMVAKKKGAKVYERHNDKKIGKGYALEYLFKKICGVHLQRNYDAYIVFDADNLVDKDFVSRINEVFSKGYEIVSPYRNSKNYDDSWLSATSSIYFLQHSRLFRYKYNHGVCCEVLGTGFLISHSILERYNGWSFFSICEDAELSICARRDGVMIGYADDAIVYDEQPATLSAFWSQRVRWVRGFFQAMKVCKSRSVAVFLDPLAIAIAIELVSLVFAMVLGIALCMNNPGLLLYFLLAIVLVYVPVFVIGLVTVIMERKRIRSSWFKKYYYTLFFPFMILLFIVAAGVALFTHNKKDWKIIKHHSKTANDLEDA